MRKDFRHIAKAFAAIVAAGMLAGCSESHEGLIYGGDIMLSSAIEGSMLWQNSRDGAASPIAGTIPETIGVFAEIKGRTGLIFTNQFMYNPWGKAVLSDPNVVLGDWPENVWPYYPTKVWEADKDYYFYCYAPYVEEDAECVPGPTYYTFYMQRIPPISATEYAVGKYYVEGSSAMGRPKLTLTHITSRLRFLFAIGKQFDQLRTIRVTSIKISDSGNGTPYWKCEVALDKYVPKSGGSQLSASELEARELEILVTASSEIYQSDTDIELIAENESDDPQKPGQTLSTEYKSFSSAYNLLGKINETYLTVVYDVYDKEDMLLRKNQTVKNRIDLSSLGDPVNGLERGKCYDVRILVSPKYLYVLSDNDIAPDAVVEPLDTP